MGNTLKMRGFAQGINAISATKKEEIGTKRITQDGRIFRYAKAGAVALAAGKMGISTTLSAYHINETGVPATIPVGTKTLTLTVSAGLAIAENELQGGFLHINDNTGEGHQYLIESNSAITSAGTTIYITLAEGIRYALTTSSDITLVRPPWYGVTEAAVSAYASSKNPVGIPPVAVTANYYYWAQTGGVAICLIQGTPAQGRKLVLGSVAGALKTMPVASADLQEAGVMLMTAGVNTEYCPVLLTIDR